jgi:hypothetical protein
MTALVYILYFLAFTIFGLIPGLIWGLYVENIFGYRIEDRKNLSGKSLVEAQIGSIRFHNLATLLNSAGLGFGIIAVFWGGTIDPRFLDVGIVVVLGSIITFLVMEWVATKYDKLVSLLAQQLAQPKIEVDLKGVALDVRMPESLVLDKDRIRLVYPSGADEQVGTSQQSTQGRS